MIYFMGYLLVGFFLWFFMAMRIKQLPGHDWKLELIFILIWPISIGAAALTLYRRVRRQ